MRTIAVTAGAAGFNAEALVPGEPRLIVLDTPDAVRVADALEGDLGATALVVAVPPGVDRRGIDAVTAAVQRALRSEGVDPRSRTVAVVPPGAPAPGAATVIEGPADVHDAWTAFTPYALVPAGLAGADLRMLLEGADHDSDDPADPALVLGALLAGADSVAITPGLGEAFDQLVGLLVTAAGGPRPVVQWPALTVGDADDETADVRVGGSPAGRLRLFQRAVAVAGYLLGVDPTAPGEPPAGVPPCAFRDGDVDVHAGRWLPAGTTTVGGALAALLDRAPGPLTVQAHLDREADASAAVLGAELARRTRRTTTFTWAPGRPPPGGLTVQLVGDVLQDGPEPPGPGPDGLRLHLRDRLTGLVTLARAVQNL